MICTVCGEQDFSRLYQYHTPDRYEQWVGITSVDRSWHQCTSCGFVQSKRNYDLSLIEKIYSNGYRDVDFRGMTIGKAFREVMDMGGRSENSKRLHWLCTKVPKFRVLDIGSGLGVVPYVLSQLGFSVDCVEKNTDSVGFLYGLGLHCYKDLPDKPYDMVTLVHVLEHIEQPDWFLQDVRKNIMPAGRLFIEVPDSKAFRYLPKEHDDFNSCHVYSFNPSGLIRVVERNGFDVTDLSRLYYQDRKLSRVLMLCRKIG